MRIFSWIQKLASHCQNLWDKFRQPSVVSPIDFSENMPEQDDTDSDISPYADPYDGFAIAFPVEDVIDLHTFAPDETWQVLDAYLEAAVEKNFESVRIIHGRGTGVQRQIVHSFLGKNPYVIRFYQAPEDSGGWGATIAVLRRSE